MAIKIGGADRFRRHAGNGAAVAIWVAGLAQVILPRAAR
jgi:hypothetical protein